MIPEHVENDSRMILEPIHNDSRLKERKGREEEKKRKEDEEKSKLVVAVDENDSVNFYTRNIGPMLPMVSDAVIQYAKDLPDELLTEGMKIAVSQNARSLKYIEKIWIRWIDAGVKTMDDYHRIEAEWESKKTAMNARAPTTGLNKKLDFNKFPQHEYAEKDLEGLFEVIGGSAN